MDTHYYSLVSSLASRLLCLKPQHKSLGTRLQLGEEGAYRLWQSEVNTEAEIFVQLLDQAAATEDTHTQNPPETTGGGEVGRRGRT